MNFFKRLPIPVTSLLNLAQCKHFIFRLMFYIQPNNLKFNENMPSKKTNAKVELIGGRCNVTSTSTNVTTNSAHCT